MGAGGRYVAGTGLQPDKRRIHGPAAPLWPQLLLAGVRSALRDPVAADVFGYSASMPQILKKSGIRYFMTTKISWNEVNRIPNDTMVWRGIDGTGILTYFITTQENKKTPGEDPDDFTTTYNGEITPSQVSGCWERYSNKGMNQDILNCFGFGDGGGGATADMLEQHARLKKGITGIPRTKQGFAKRVFSQAGA